MENLEMKGNREILEKRYKQSLDSGESDLAV